MIVENALIVEHQHFIAPQSEPFHLLILESPSIAKEAYPGQFVMLKIYDGYDPLLRRPFSIFFAEGQRIAIFYKVVGRGTQLMVKWKPGQRVNLLGPLGRGFKPFKSQSQLLIAGGAGIAPLFFLYRSLKYQFSPVIMWGLRYRIAKDLWHFFKEQIPELIIYTEDGSLGYKGLVTEGLDNLLSQRRFGGIYACGPMPMLKALYQRTSPMNIPLQVSLEAQMACGLGTCLGCVVSGKMGYLKVCRDGPVFDAKDIKWDR